LVERRKERKSYVSLISYAFKNNRF
jgi:hypothetical protein